MGYITSLVEQKFDEKRMFNYLHTANLEKIKKKQIKKLDKQVKDFYL
jgi:predicted HAD superfamily Cof-like phosphohydrolase